MQNTELLSHVKSMLETRAASSVLAEAAGPGAGGGQADATSLQVLQSLTDQFAQQQDSGPAAEAEVCAQPAQAT